MKWSRLKLTFLHRIQVRYLQRSAVPNRETSTRIHGPHWPCDSFDVHVVCPRLRRFLKSHTYKSNWEKNSIFDLGPRGVTGRNHGTTNWKTHCIGSAPRALFSLYRLRWQWHRAVWMASLEKSNRTEAAACSRVEAASGHKIWNHRHMEGGMDVKLADL